MRESIEFVRGLVARENARGVATDRIFLVGFSQGGAIALAAGLRHPDALAGVAALSTYLPIAESSEAERTEANRTLPVRGTGSAPARAFTCRPSGCAAARSAQPPTCSRSVSWRIR